MAKPWMSPLAGQADSDLEKLYTYARFLLTKLPRRKSGPAYNFDNEVTLKYYRLEKISQGRIDLRTGEAQALYGPTEVGTGKIHEEMVYLSQLIDILNDRFGTNFTQADQLFLNQIREEAAADDNLRQAAKANTIVDFKYVFEKALEGLFIDRMEGNEDIFARQMNDDEFRAVAAKHLLHKVYDQIREPSDA